MTMKNIKTKLAIIGTVGVPARYGGFETLAHQLVLNLNKEFDLTVYNSTKHYTAKERVEKWNGANIKYLPISANGIWSIPYDIISMIHALIFCDVILMLGVSGALFLPFVKLFFPSKKIIVNVDGLEWRRPKWKSYAKAFLLNSEKIAVRFADEVIADNAAIQKYVLDKYKVNANLIEYGADHNQPEKFSLETRLLFPFLEKEYAFKVARVEPENNIKMILEAFTNQKQLPLVFVGNWGSSDYGRSLRAEFGDSEQLHLLDPIYEPQLLNELRSNAKLYIHGHSAGGTNPSLVEAMYLGLPVVSIDAIYNKITTENKALFFSNKKELTRLVSFADSFELDKVAADLTAVAYRRYTWSVISEKYSALATGKAKKSIPTFDFELPLQLKRTIS